MNRILAAALGASLLAASGVAVAQDHPDNGRPAYDHRADRGGDHHDWRRHARSHRQICHWRHHHRVCSWG
jgi:hypothetical protein